LDTQFQPDRKMQRQLKLAIHSQFVQPVEGWIKIEFASRVGAECATPERIRRFIHGLAG